MRPRSLSWIPPALLAAVTITAAPTVQAATCFSDPAIIGAVDVAFVGTLTGFGGADDQATFAVEEVWSAGSLPATVVVNASSGTFTGYELATRYLVLSSVVAGNLRLTNQECNIAVPWDASFAALRPATSHPPVASTENGGPPFQLLLAAGVMLAIGLVSLFAFRRRERGSADG